MTLERMGEERLVKRLYGSNVEGRRGRGRPRRVWIDGVEEIIREKGLDIRDARELTRDRGEWSRRFFTG